MEIGSLSFSDIKFEKVHAHKKTVMKWFESCFINAPPSNRSMRKGLNTSEISFLLTIIDPENPSVIGRDKAVRYRNYISVMIMLNFGLRPGELLSLKLEDIQFGGISCLRVTRRSPDPLDTRKPKPQIKRNGRALPILDHNFAHNLNQYIMKWREELSEASIHVSDYLILSDAGEPLSQPSITQFFKILRQKYPNNLPSHLTAKALRHTFSSFIERELRSGGMDEESRKSALAILRGDSSLESQNLYIAQEVEEQAEKILMRLQQKLLIQGIGL